MSDFDEGGGPEKALCINPKCRKQFQIPANHQGRKPVLCPDCKEAGVKVKDLGLPEQKKAKKAVGKPARKKADHHEPTPTRPVQQNPVYKVGTIEIVDLVPKLRGYKTDEAAIAYLEGFLEGRKVG